LNLNNFTSFEATTHVRKPGNDVDETPGETLKSLLHAWSKLTPSLVNLAHSVLENIQAAQSLIAGLNAPLDPEILVKNVPKNTV
jgi:hypothetical protein